MHLDPEQFARETATSLGLYYLAVGALNVGAAVKASMAKHWIRAGAWSLAAGGLAVLAGQAVWGAVPLGLSESCKASIDAMLGPVTLSVGCFVALVVLFLGRRLFVIPAVAWLVFNASLLWMGLSMTDPEFAAIVAKPDNVPIVAMVYLLGLFTWWSASLAVANDDRRRQGLPPLEKEREQKVLVWPDLVYTELICMVLVSIVLIVWSLELQAPLEGPANPVVTPNPSKAPWYFLGLQELLVYADPWLVGVVVPGLIIGGLMAVPYLDRNERGSGYYTIKERPLAYLVFQFGFLQLWVLLILIGTFMRGPNWNFFGLYEFHDPYKVVALSNVKLSELFWIDWLGRELPVATEGAGVLSQLAHILWREMAGVTFLAVYFLATPLLLGRTVFHGLRRKLGLGRYALMSFLLLMMLTLPLKMILRWTMNVNYIVSIPEYFFNF